MKKYILILAFLAAGLQAFAQKKAAKEPAKEPSNYILADFREIKWGSHIDSIYRNGTKLTFTKAPEMADKNAYTLENEDMMVGTVLLKNLYFMFNAKGRFTGVTMIAQRELDTKKQIGEMKYILTYKFGNPELREIPNAIQYYWMVDDVRITLNDEESVGLFTVEFFSDYERNESKKVNMNVDDF